MALKIIDDCINCDRCAPECPNNAITMGAEIFEINPALCTECVGHHEEPRCIDSCPVECIVKSPDDHEDRAALMKKFERLTMVIRSSDGQPRRKFA